MGACSCGETDPVEAWKEILNGEEYGYDKATQIGDEGDVWKLWFVYCNPNERESGDLGHMDVGGMKLCAQHLAIAMRAKWPSLKGNPRWSAETVRKEKDSGVSEDPQTAYFAVCDKLSTDAGVSALATRTPCMHAFRLNSNPYALCYTTNSAYLTSALYPVATPCLARVLIGKLMALFYAQGQELFDAFDRNQDGQISAQEYLDWMREFNYKNKALKQIVVGDESQRKFNVRGELAQIVAKYSKVFNNH